MCFYTTVNFWQIKNMIGRINNLIKNCTFIFNTVIVERLKCKMLQNRNKNIVCKTKWPSFIVLTGYQHSLKCRSCNLTLFEKRVRFSAGLWSQTFNWNLELNFIYIPRYLYVLKRNKCGLVCMAFTQMITCYQTPADIDKSF